MAEELNPEMPESYAFGTKPQIDADSESKEEEQLNPQMDTDEHR